MSNSNACTLAVLILSLSIGCAPDGGTVIGGDAPSILIDAINDIVGGGGGSDSDAPVDLTGEWTGICTVTEPGCDWSIGEQGLFELDVTQIGESLSVIVNGNSGVGTVSGNQISLVLTYPDFGGVTTETIAATVIDCSTVVGSSTAVWTSGSSTCTYAHQLEINRVGPCASEPEGEPNEDPTSGVSHCFSDDSQCYHIATDLVLSNEIGVDQLGTIMVTITGEALEPLDLQLEFYFVPLISDEPPGLWGDPQSVVIWDGPQPAGSFQIEAEVSSFTGTSTGLYMVLISDYSSLNLCLDELCVMFE